MGLKIVDLKAYVPEKRLSNDDLSKIMDTSDDWIRNRTGIEYRHVVEDEDTTDLAIKAAKDLNFDKDKIDLIIVATFTPDLMIPNTASMVQKELGIKEDVMAFDFNMACTGFVGGLKVAEGLLKEGRQAIVIGAEVISKTLDGDRSVAVLFGDGAGACVVEKNQEQMNFDIGNIGNFEDLHALGHVVDKDRDIYLRMNGTAVFRFATKVMVKTIKQSLKNYNLTYDDIDYFVCHQANKRIIDYVAKKLDQSEDKFFTNLQEYGNTSAASIPIALYDMYKQGLIKPGTKTLLAGFGGGLSWASTLLKW